MPPSWVIYLLVFWILLDIIQGVLFALKLQKLNSKHNEEMSVAKHNAFNHGWNEARLSLPIVQHCNRRTDYELIRHQWDPDACKECKIIRDLLDR